MKKRLNKKITCMILIVLLLGMGVVPFKSVVAMKSTEAIEIAKEIKRIKEQRIKDAKTATIIKFDIDDKAAMEEDEQYIKSLENRLEVVKTGDNAESSIIDGILGVEKVKAAYNQTVYQNNSKYIIKNLPVDNAIQKTYVGSTFIYVLQRVGNDIYFSRYYKTTGEPTDIETKDGIFNGRSKFMLLRGFGHPQSLEWFSYNNKAYFWICCGGKNFGNASNPVYWSTEIARIQYTVGATVNSSACNRLINVEYADTKGDGTNFGVLKRVDMALSSDKSELCIWSRDTSAHDRFTFYNTSKLNKALDVKNARSCRSKDVKAACKSYATINNIPGLATQSVQGIELTNNSNVYVASGDRNNLKQIVKVNEKAKLQGKKNLTTPAELSAGNSEIEGLQISGDYLLFGIVGLTNLQQQEQYIYQINKSAVK